MRRSKNKLAGHEKALVGLVSLGIAVLAVGAYFLQSRGESEAAERFASLTTKGHDEATALPEGTIVHTVAKQESPEEVDDSARPDPYHLDPNDLFPNNLAVESWSEVGPDGSVILNRVVARDSTGAVVQELIEDEETLTIFDGIANFIYEEPATGSELAVGIDEADLSATSSQIEQLSADQQAGKDTEVFKVSDGTSGGFLEVELSKEDGFLLRRTTFDSDGNVVEEFAIDVLEILPSANIPTELQFAGTASRSTTFELPELNELNLLEAAAEAGGLWRLGAAIVSSYGLVEPEVVVIGPSLEAESAPLLEMGPFPFVEIGVAYQVDYQALALGSAHVGLFHGEAEAFTEVLKRLPPLWQESSPITTTAGDRPANDAWLLRIEPLDEGGPDRWGLLLLVEEDLLLLLTQGLSSDDLLSIATGLEEITP